MEMIYIEIKILFKKDYKISKKQYIEIDGNYSLPSKMCHPKGEFCLLKMSIFTYNLCPSKRK